ncbi:exonuclease RecJ [Limimonas halophila]|uniref:Single-stranded-DNA-specific exonuclease RecJ n=1 Tax=Limimonas halophila TaxID=1082479 RepID=A0A1G7NQ10_9PROT|nr:single-stranded-DNA-specific exonuclease RecJ [Limimonas halophila]SDF76072.1 exonuclease RecJ [Limimonas halophila]
MSEAVASERPAVLGVERSVSGKRWYARGDDDRLARALAQRLGVSELVGRVMAGRGVGLAEAENFLNPSLRSDLPDPAGFQDMDRAAARLVEAAQRGESVALFADYDVDGATSAALLNRFLRHVGLTPRIYVPDRIAEGYGPNEAAVETLHNEGHSLIVCLDCGITAFEPLQHAQRLGVDTIVVDHHQAEPHLPPAVAVVNPNRLDESGAHGQLAAVGVTFLTVVALNRALRQAGFYGASRPEPDLRRWLDLVALGTVADVVPLTGVNRALVARGLDVAARRGNPGLAALGDLARLDERPTPFHCGFVLGPRINAGGRIGRADMGARLLSTDRPGEAAEIAGELDRLNTERKEMESAVLDAAMAQVDQADALPPGLVLVAGSGWHPGVIGIVASRLVERYQRPAIVVAFDEEGRGQGSGRSVPGVDLGAAVIAARQAGVLDAGGGHPMAAGLSVSADKLRAAQDFLTERLSSALAASGYVPSMSLDGTVRPRGATLDTVRALEDLGPYGTGNPEPRFAVADARVVGADVVGGNHVRCTLTDETGARLKAIAFRAVDEPVGQALLNTRGGTVHVAGKLRLDRWAGRNGVQLIVDDVATSGS